MKILVLGSDYFALSVVKTAIEMGHYVIVTDLMETSPAKEAASEAWMISTTDIDYLEQKCKEQNVGAIMFGASDFNVENARTLCKRLELPLYCSNDTAWNTSRDKSLFKQACINNNVNVAKDYFLSDALTTEELDSVEFPVVVKPVDKSGNRGISFCNSKKELIDGYKEARGISEGKIIVEQRLYGTEHNICYAVVEGECRLVSYSQLYHISGEATNLYSFEITTNNHLNQFIEEVNDNLIKTFKAIGCTDGIVWVDAMWNESDKKFYILEMGYRFPAALASCTQHEIINGYNPVKWMIEVATGVMHTAKDMPNGLIKPYSSVVGLIHLFTKRKGRIKRVIGIPSLLELGGVHIDMPKRENDAVRGLTCIALISVFAETLEDLLNKADLINSTLSITDEEDSELIYKFDEFEKVVNDFERKMDV